MRLAQPTDPLFHRLQVVADRAAIAHFAPATFLSGGRQDTVFVDIESKIEFFLHGVFASSSCLNCNAPEPSGSGRWCGSAPLTRVAREKI